MVIRPYEFGQVPFTTPIANGSIVKGGGKVGHVGGSNVDIALSTFRKTVPSTVIYEVDQQPVEGEMDVPSGDVRARSPGLRGGGGERSGKLPGVRTAPGQCRRSGKMSA